MSRNWCSFVFEGEVTPYNVYITADELTDVVDTGKELEYTPVEATEYEAFGWGYEDSAQAWEAVRREAPRHPNGVRKHPGKYFENFGYIEGTHQSSYNTDLPRWGAYLWVLQNTVRFTAYDELIWYSPGGHVPNTVQKVIVCSLGEYDPQTEYEEDWPGFPQIPERDSKVGIYDDLDPGERKSVKFTINPEVYLRLGPAGDLEGYHAYRTDESEAVDEELETDPGVVICGYDGEEGAREAKLVVRGIPTLANSSRYERYLKITNRQKILMAEAGSEPVAVEDSSYPLEGSITEDKTFTVTASGTWGGDDYAAIELVIRDTVTEEEGASDRVKFVVLSVELEEATFRDDNHPLKRDDGTFASEGIDNVRSPQILNGAESTEICYSWASSPQISDAKFSISPDLNANSISALIRVEGTQVGRTGTLVYQKNVSLSGAEATETLTTTDALASVVDNTIYQLTWKISFDAGASYTVMTTTANRLFVTAGTPSPSAGAVTLKRMDTITRAACGQHDLGGIIEKLHENIFRLVEVRGAGPPDPLWRALDDNNVHCVDYVNLWYEKVIPMLTGNVAGERKFLWARSDGATHESDTPADSNLERRTCTIVDPVLDVEHGNESFRFVPGGVGGSPDYRFPNAYQAVLIHNSKYFPPAFPEKMSKEEITDMIFPYVTWWFKHEDGFLYHCPPTYLWPEMSEVE